MTPDEKARAEALGVMRGAREQVGLTVQEQARYVEGFVAGSAWQRSQPVEITEEMIESVKYHRWHPVSGLCGCKRHFTTEDAFMRHALSAALGGDVQ